MNGQKHCLPKVEFSREELLSQNELLSEELTLCQKDKAFVWELWNKLQVERPDMASVVATVMQREQEKNDKKERKVLKILQQKDQKISMLQEICDTQQGKIEEQNEKIEEVALEAKNAQMRFFKEKEGSEINIDKLNSLVRNKDDEIFVLEEKISTCQQEFETNNAGLQEKIDGLYIEVKALTENLIDAEKQIRTSRLDCNEKLTSKDREIEALKQSYEDVVKNNSEDFETLEQELKKKCKEVQTTKKEYENLSIEKEKLSVQHQSQLATLEQVKDKQKNELREKDKQLSILIKEHTCCSRHIGGQSELIVKLEALQEESQQVLNKQQETHLLEVKALEQTVKEYSSNAQKYQDRYVNLSAKNKNLQEDNRLLRNSECEHCVSVKQNFEELREKYEELNENFSGKCRDMEQYYDRNGPQESEEKINLIFTDVSTKFKDLVESLEEENETLRSALQRVKEQKSLLHDNYTLALQQLKTYDHEELPCILNEIESPEERASERSLQHEDSKSVWNELEHYRKQNQRMVQERAQLIEEVEDFKVKFRHDKTTIHQLQIKIIDQQRDYEKRNEERKEKQVHVEATQIFKLKQDVNNYHNKFKGCEECLSKQIEINNKLLQHEEKLKVELLTLRRELDSRTNIITNSTSSQTDYGPSLQEERRVNFEKTSSTKCSQTDRATEHDLLSKMEQVFKAVTTKETNSFEKGKVLLNSASTFTTNIQTLLTTSTQTETEIDVIKKLKPDQMATLKTTIRENKSLKKKLAMLQSQIFNLRETKTVNEKRLSELKGEISSVKQQLLQTTNKFQITRDQLQAQSTKSQEGSLESIREKLLNAEKERDRLSTAIKDTEERARISTQECSKLSFQTKTTRQENQMLAEKINIDQERISMLESDLTSKKTLVTELKQKLKKLKSRTDEDLLNNETLQTQVQELSAREKKSKSHIENLKSKFHDLIMEKKTLTSQVESLKTQLKDKCQSLSENEKICKQAESALNNMEETAFQHLQTQYTKFEANKLKLEESLQKTTLFTAEVKDSIKNFVRTLLVEIEENHSLIARRKQHRGTENTRVHDLACSILSMSASDLTEFMQEQDENEEILKFNSAEVNEKLLLILNKEVNISSILEKFLLDLVQFNAKLHSEANSTGDRSKV